VAEFLISEVVILTRVLGLDASSESRHRSFPSQKFFKKPAAGSG
jgi:hypothetical protein